MRESIITPLNLDLFDSDFEQFASGLGQSFERCGFAVVTLPSKTKLKAGLFLAAWRAFFSLPEQAKHGYVLKGGAGQRGYTPFGVETAKGAAHHDLKEFWHIGRDLPPEHPFRSIMPDNIWPAEIPDIRDISLELFSAFDCHGRRLLQAISHFLGLERTEFESSVKDGNSILRILHYPPVEGSVPNVRAGAHEDINAITLLLGAEEAGLELKDRDGNWQPVTPPPGCIVVNIGDMLQRLTNNRLPSTTHRVVNPVPERARFSRYSMPFFLHFRPDFEIRTLPQCISPENPDRYPQPITAQEFLRQRLREIKLA